MAWAQRDSTGTLGLVNLEATQDIRVQGPDGDGKYYLTAIAGSAGGQLNGRWDSAVDAQEACRKLVDGIDPSTY